MEVTGRDDCVRVPLDQKLFKSHPILYRMKECVFPGTIITSGVMEKIPDFELRDDDIIVASFPKAGTTWTQEIVHMLTHNFEASTNDSEVLEKRFPYIEHFDPGFKALMNAKGRKFIKTHLPFSLLPKDVLSKQTKVIYVMRNPRDTVVSLFHFMQMLSDFSFIGSFEEMVDMFITDRVFYSPYFEHISGYYKERERSNLCLINYEDMKKDPILVINKLSEFLKVPITHENALKIAAATTFSKMAENKSVNYEQWRDTGFANKDIGKFMRKGEVGDWRNHFDAETLAMFEKWEKSKAFLELPSFDY